MFKTFRTGALLVAALVGMSAAFAAPPNVTQPTTDAFLASSPATANRGASAADKCVPVGQVVQSIAQARDAGVDSTRVLAIVLTNTSPNVGAVARAKAEVDYAYSNRYLKPDELAQLRQNACVSRLLRGST